MFPFVCLPCMWQWGLTRNVLIGDLNSNLKVDRNLGIDNSENTIVVGHASDSNHPQLLTQPIVLEARVSEHVPANVAVNSLHDIVLIPHEESKDVEFTWTAEIVYKSKRKPIIQKLSPSNLPLLAKKESASLKIEKIRLIIVLRNSPKLVLASPPLISIYVDSGFPIGRILQIDAQMNPDRPVRSARDLKYLPNGALLM